MLTQKNTCLARNRLALVCRSATPGRDTHFLLVLLISLIPSGQPVIQVVGTSASSTLLFTVQKYHVVPLLDTVGLFGTLGHFQTFLLAMMHMHLVVPLGVHEESFQFWPSGQ